MKLMRSALLFILAFSAVASLTVSAEEGARKIKERVQPVYPETAKNMHITGVVRLEVTITTQGAVKNAKILGGHPMLADAAVKAVSRWRYEAGPEETRVVSIDFKQ